MAKFIDQNRLNSLQDIIQLRAIPEFDAYPLKPSSYSIDVKLSALPFLKGKEARAPIDLVAVIDRSGSMDGEELELVKKVLHFVVSHLKAFDRLGIVVYDDEIEEIAPLTKVTTENCTKLDKSIAEIEADGSTNLCGGLLKGMSMMKERIGEMADVASILLLTDGNANSGITDTSTIIIEMNKLYGETKKFTVNTFGFGSYHKVEMLKEISKTGNGLYYFIQNTEQIPEIFSDCLGGLLSTVAQDISVSIETCKGALVKEILSKVKPTMSADNKLGKVLMGDLQSEEEHDLLVNLTLPEIENAIGGIDNPDVYAKISLRYYNVIKKIMDTVQTEVAVPRCNDPGDRLSSMEVEEQRIRTSSVASISSAAELASRGDREGARNILRSQEQMINTLSSRTSDKVASLKADISHAMMGVSDEQTYLNFGRSTFATLEDSHSSQRSTSLSSNSYTTNSRRKTFSGFMASYDEFNEEDTIMPPEILANTEIKSEASNSDKKLWRRRRSHSLASTFSKLKLKKKESKPPDTSKNLDPISESKEDKSI